jgi:hypothetical protein
LLERSVVRCVPHTVHIQEALQGLASACTDDQDHREVVPALESSVQVEEAQVHAAVPEVLFVLLVLAVQLYFLPVHWEHQHRRFYS